MVLIAFFVTASHYFSYPRFDNYFNSHGFSTSPSDIKAVRIIDEMGGDNNYIVLANQQVSAAALSEFGFKKYYKNDIFYYPIPTASPLYQYYLKMAYEKPDKKTALAAADSVGADKVFFVINKYWTKFPKIADEAKEEADEWKEVDNGQVFIFTYKNN